MLKIADFFQLKLGARLFRPLLKFKAFNAAQRTAVCNPQSVLSAFSVLVVVVVFLARSLLVEEQKCKFIT